MSSNFKTLGFEIVKNMYDVKNHTLSFPDLFNYVKTNYSNSQDDTQSPGAPAFYKDIELNKLQIRILPKMEEITGLKLYPTYNYFRIYNSESILKSHIDRPACEISVTINLGYEGDYNWPIFIEDKNKNTHSIILEPGDGLVYMGCDLPHWREDADERVKSQIQLFVHFVDQYGKYENCINDEIKLKHQN